MQDMRRPRPNVRARRAVRVPRGYALGPLDLCSDVDFHRQGTGAEERQLRGVRRGVGGRVRRSRAFRSIPGGIRASHARPAVVRLRQSHDGRPPRARRAPAQTSRTASSGAVAGVVTARRGQETERVRPMERARGEGDVPGRPAERRVRRGQALPGVARRKEDRESKCDVRMRMFRTGDGGRRRRGWDETRPARRGRRDARNPARPTPIGYRRD